MFSSSRPKQPIVVADLRQFSCFSWHVTVRSSIRRYALATPASVHCMSRQLLFGDLSLALGSGHPRNGELFTIHRIISHWINVCAPWGLFASSASLGFSGFSSLTGADPVGSFPRTETVASHQTLCTLFSMCATVQTAHLLLECMPRSSSQQSSHCGTGYISHHT